VRTDFKYRFRFDGKGKNDAQSNVIKALSKSINNRDVRVHDDIRDWHCDPSVNAFNTMFDRGCRRKADLSFLESPTADINQNTFKINHH